MSKSSLVNANIPASTSNYDRGRAGRGIQYITIHHMAGNLSIETCGGVFQNPNTQASAHYGVGTDGRIGQYVDESDTAWSNGNYDSNCKSVSIEIANDTIGGNWHVSDTALNSAIRLVADIAKRNGLGTLVKGQNLVWHSMFVATTCPGDYLRSKIDYIISEANKINNNPNPTPTPTPSGNATIKSIQNTLNSRYGLNIDVDGIFGPETKKAMVKGLQTEFRIQLGATLDVDGIFGPITKRNCPNLEITDEGNITWLVQSMLIIKGYNLDNDGIFGPDTQNKVRAFQSSVGIAVDGICGEDTFEKLFS